MKTEGMVVLLALTLAFAGWTPAADTPNIIYIMADDLGYGELGCFGQRLIQTPNLDKFADFFVEYHYWCGFIDRLRDKVHIVAAQHRRQICSRHIAELGTQDLTRALLVRRIAISVHEADRERLDRFGLHQITHLAPERAGVEGLQLLATGRHAPGHPTAQVARHQRR